MSRRKKEVTRKGNNPKITLINPTNPNNPNLNNPIGVYNVSSIDDIGGERVEGLICDQLETDNCAKDGKGLKCIL